jgi:hypothetical protein
MPTRPLPARPSLEHLKAQARDIMRDHAAATPQACQRLREFHPRFAGLSDSEAAATALGWSDALLAIAREYGFASWARLKHRVDSAGGDLPLIDRISDPAFREAVSLMDDGDAAGLSQHLKAHPGLAASRTVFEGLNYFRNPGLIAFVADNPIRNGGLPPGAVEIARLVLEAGGAKDPAAVDEALGLAASGLSARQSGLQTALIDLFCDYGAKPDGAMLAALGHGEFAAAERLLDRGARLSLPVATGLGRETEAIALMALATAAERHLALALAAQFGRDAVLRRLLEAGEDPDRFNPVGLHAHSTPLHQAALMGRRTTVDILLAFGARRDIRDILWNGTPAGWARHGGHDDVAQILEPIGD